MHVEKFNAKKSQRLSLLILEQCNGLSYNAVQKIIRNKDVKVNGVRVNKDISVQQGDEIIFYVKENQIPKIDILFEDENIIVCHKPLKLETVSETNDNDLEKQISNQINSQCYAVHRLDRNTEGLVVFAKNMEAKFELDNAFKNRTIKKLYLALVFGKLSKSEDDMIAYLKKDSKKSFVQISDNPKQNYEKIETKYKLLKQSKSHALVEVELVTGKTHQIRAHFAHIGHFVIGDEKYGESEINKLYNKKFQCLCAYKIIFHFDKSSILSYLDNKEIKIENDKISFIKDIK